MSSVSRFVFPWASDGSGAFEQLINLISSKGVIFVASAGKDVFWWPDVSGQYVYPYPSGAVLTPGAADSAITVSAADIANTVNRDDDDAPYVMGTRLSDHDFNTIDELKPEVVFPTGGAKWPVSNSVATAATAGLVALILDYNEDLADFDNKASGSVKDLLIRSAEYKESRFDEDIEWTDYPNGRSTWDEMWGFGEIDAFQAFIRLSNGQQGVRRI